MINTRVWSDPPGSHGFEKCLALLQIAEAASALDDHEFTRELFAEAWSMGTKQPQLQLNAAYSMARSGFERMALEHAQKLSDLRWRQGEIVQALAF